MYWSRIISRGWDMTRADFGFHDTRATFVKIAWLIVALMIMYIFNWDELLISRLGELGAGVLALFLLFLLVCVLNICAAIPKLHQEAENEIAKLRGRLDTRAGRQAALNELWRLRSDGISIRNRSIETEKEYQQWHKEYEKWRIEVLEKAEVLTINLRNWLERLDTTVTDPTGRKPFNPDHELKRRIMSTILHRMQVYLEKEL